MQQLWGLIRALQLISLSALLNIPYTINLFIFLQICVNFASMDIMNGEDFYEEHFTFHETSPINEAYEFFGIDNKNFILNSGSYLVI